MIESITEWKAFWLLKRLDTNHSWWIYFCSGRKIGYMYACMLGLVLTLMNRRADWSLLATWHRAWSPEVSHKWLCSSWWGPDPWTMLDPLYRCGGHTWCLSRMVCLRGRRCHDNERHTNLGWNRASEEQKVIRKTWRGLRLAIKSPSIGDRKGYFRSFIQSITRRPGFKWKIHVHVFSCYIV